MPVWMALTLALHLSLLWLTWRWPTSHTLFLIWAVTLWIIIIVFSLVGAVPINDQVKAWELARLPEDWKAKRRRWDVQNAARVVLIGLAFIALVLSFRTLPLQD
jgi:FtsH-binding integral membrane protein